MIKDSFESWIPGVFGLSRSILTSSGLDSLHLVHQVLMLASLVCFAVHPLLDSAYSFAGILLGEFSCCDHYSHLHHGFYASKSS